MIMTKHDLILQFSMYSRHLKLGVVVHPAHRSRSEGGFLGTIHRVQGFHNHIYCLEMALLPVPDRKAGLCDCRWQRPCRYISLQQLCSLLCGQFQRQTSGLSPVLVCSGPAVTKESSHRLGTIFVFVMVLSC